MNVYEATQARLAFIFAEFDCIQVAFSGGKDSGVLLNMVIEYATQHQRLDAVHVYHLDYEAQYTATTEYVDAVFADLPDPVHKYRCCVPVKCPTCTSMYQQYWQPWAPDKQALWVRDLPPHAITSDHFDEDVSLMSDYQFNEYFSQWLQRTTGAQQMAVLIGTRTDESLDRWRQIHSDHRTFMYQDVRWTKTIDENIHNAYPIYDWRTSDIWVANATLGWSYNKLYDLFHLAGVPLENMRVASPFHDAAKASLKLYRVLDPDVWSRMVSRVNGVNFTSIYGGSNAMGWKQITKPAHFTWQQYMNFLLDTLPQETAQNYRTKLATSIRVWATEGGARDAATIAELNAEGAPFIRTGRTSKRGAGDKEVIIFTDYPDDTNVTNFKDIPSYKRMCVCILRNDHLCKYMGFSANKAERERRKAAESAYKNILQA